MDERLQFPVLAIWFGLVLPLVVGVIMWGWSWVREKVALWRAGRGRGG
jgi:hypothetical protein